MTENDAIRDLTARITATEAKVGVIEAFAATMKEEVMELRKKAEEQGIMIAERGELLKGLGGSIAEIKSTMLPDISKAISQTQETIAGLKLDSGLLKTKVALLLALLMFLANALGTPAGKLVSALLSGQDSSAAVVAPAQQPARP